MFVGDIKLSSFVGISFGVSFGILGSSLATLPDFPRSLLRGKIENLFHSTQLKS